MAERGDAVAATLGPVLEAVLPGGLPVAVRYWDGSVSGPDPSPATIVVRSPRALRRILWAPDELGLGRAYVAGEIDVEGDLYAALALRDALGCPSGRHSRRLGAGVWWRAVVAARRLSALGPPPSALPEEARLRGRRHGLRRDRAAISFHYDISNDFYRLVLGPTMTYSCAHFNSSDTSLEEAQACKYDLVCRKLGLEPGMRLLDAGCGWGGMVLHAASRYGARAVGVTISEAQAELAAKRVAEENLDSRIEIRLCDYRDIDDGPYDAVSSVGMFEHVGLALLSEYFTRMFRLLRPGGRLLNRGITRPIQSGGFPRRSFIDRYVFPDGALHEVGRVVSTMGESGFEVATSSAYVSTTPAPCGLGWPTSMLTGTPLGSW